MSSLHSFIRSHRKLYSDLTVSIIHIFYSPERKCFQQSRWDPIDFHLNVSVIGERISKFQFVNWNLGKEKWDFKFCAVKSAILNPEYPLTPERMCISTPDEVQLISPQIIIIGE